MEGAGSIIRILALTASFGGHVGLAAWILLAPAPPALPEQRIVEVALVAPSAPYVTEMGTAPSPSPSLQPMAPALTKGIVKPSSPIQAIASTPTATPTTGETAPEALPHVAAITHVPQQAQPLHNPTPVYPPAARRRGQQGSVLLNVHVSSEGEAETVTLITSSGYESLDKSALEAVQAWRFMPAQQEGESVASTLRLPIVFRLD